MKKVFMTLAIIVMAIGLTQCTKDSEEALRGGGCLTENLSYSEDISRIIDIKCNACHSTENRFGGVILDNYDNLSTYANNGKLSCTIEHASGCSPMPQGSDQLSQCNIDKINAWINDGAQNN